MLHKSVSSYMNLCQKTRTGSDRVAKVEGAQALGTVVVAVEEAVVHAAVGLALAVVGLLDLEGAMRQRRAGHLDAAEAALLLHRGEVHLGAKHFLHAADVLAAVEAVDVAVDEAAADLDTSARLDHFVAERATLAALPYLGASYGHWVSLGRSDRGTKRNPAIRQRARRRPATVRSRSGGSATAAP